MNIDRVSIEKIAAGKGYRLAVPTLDVDVDLSEWARALSKLLDMREDYNGAWTRAVARRTHADLSLTATIERLADERDAAQRMLEKAANS